MNIRYYLRGTKEIKNIYVRLVSKGIDVSAPIGIFMRENQWDSKKEVCRSPKSTAILFKLKGILMDRYNQSYCSGEVIDKEWVKNVVKEAFKRPKQEVGLVSKEHTVYLVPFAKYWLEEHARSWKVSAMETMGENLKKQYSNFVLMLELYEDSRHTKTKLKEANVDFIYDFVSYMLKEQKLSRSTAHRNIIRLKFFLKRAVELDFETHKDYLKPVYLEKQPEVQDVYLSEAEIQKMYDLDISGDYKLEAAKDNFIMSCWLGLRVSDFMTRFDASSIKDGYVSIKTQKTGSFVVIPLHPMVKSILNKRMGNLPPKLYSTEYNKLIKKVAKLAGIDEVIYGKKYNSETDRKEIGYYPKYELVTSHTGRKSLCTNLYGKVSLETIMAVMGWSSDSMTKYYNKTSTKEYAQQLNEYYNGNIK